MDLYHTTFAGAILLNALALYRTHRHHISSSSTTPSPTQQSHPEKPAYRSLREEADRSSLRRLKHRFFPIYLLVNAADWLQGPYIYPIYKDEKGLPEHVVALLFMVGFVAAGVSASICGTLADRYGRKKACLAYCVLYSWSCVAVLGSDIRVLVLGRVLGGISGTLLYSVFESWLVAEVKGLSLEEELEGEELSHMFGKMTTGNGVVAIAAGVLAEWLVGWSGTRGAPFLAAIVCLGVAFVGIERSWAENFGTRRQDTEETTALLEEQKPIEQESTSSALGSILKDKNVLVLALTSCFFEGSLFLFIFFKFPALTLSHKLSGSDSDLPFGLIFAILMCSMMLGSLVYNHLTTVTASNNDTSPSLPTKRILTATLAIASLCFLIPSRVRDERVTLWCFCVFELCCGVYYPVMASLKGRLVSDGRRASVYGWLRVPLNVFVVLALSTTQEGEKHRDLVFTTCSALLVVVAVVVQRTLA